MPFFPNCSFSLNFIVKIELCLLLYAALDEPVRNLWLIFVSSLAGGMEGPMLLSLMFSILNNIYIYIFHFRPEWNSGIQEVKTILLNHDTAALRPMRGRPVCGEWAYWHYIPEIWTRFINLFLINEDRTWRSRTCLLKNGKVTERRACGSPISIQ